MGRMTEEEFMKKYGIAKEDWKDIKPVLKMFNGTITSLEKR